jgi:hypothetical protein
MFSILLAISLSITQDPAPIEMEAYRANLSSATREELALVDKVRALRSSVEKLPEGWKASGLMAETTSKEALLAEIEGLEFSAAERWSILLNNTAFLDRVSDPKAFEARRELSNVPKLQGEVVSQIERINFKLRDGVLLNLASKVMLH